MSRFPPAEEYFLILSLFFGIIFVFVTPALQAPDEDYHFLHSYQVAEWNFSAHQKERDWGIQVPHSVAVTLKVNDNLPHHPENRVDPANAFSQLTTKLNVTDRSFVSFYHTSPISHLPQAVGIYFGKQFNLSPLILMYMGRITNLLTFILMVYFAIKILPVYKHLASACSLMPMTLFQAASLSYDALLIASSFLFTAMILRIAFSDEKPHQKEIVVILLLIVIISAIKIPYYALALLYFIIPYQKIGTKKRYYAILTLLMVMPVIIMLLWKLSMMTFHLIPPWMDKTHIIPATEIKNVLANSPAALSAIPQTVLAQGYSYYVTFVGDLGWLDTNLPNTLIFYYSFFLIFLSLTDNDEKIVINTRMKGIFAFVFGLELILLEIVFFVTWTPPDSQVIEGVQGRYLIPVCLPAFLLFDNKIFSRRISFINNNLNMITILSIVVTLIITTITLLQRYYIPL